MTDVNVKSTAQLNLNLTESVVEVFHIFRFIFLRDVYINNNKIQKREKS